MNLVHGDEYLDFHPAQFVVLFLIPVTIYGVVAIALGMLLSLVVSIYPLSTHYYKCNSTSMISSGSYYARTKEMCKERTRLRAEEREASKEKPE